MSSLSRRTVWTASLAALCLFLGIFSAKAEPSEPSKGSGRCADGWSAHAGRPPPRVSPVRIPWSASVRPCPPDTSVLPPHKLPTGLESQRRFIPKGNPVTPEKADLGRMLFFDVRLSRNGTVSCAVCHDPLDQWSEQARFPIGLHEEKGPRHTPTIINRIFSEAQFWDGRATTLEEQVLAPIVNPIEMGFTHEEMTDRLASVPGYGPFFEAAFGDPAVTTQRVGSALATFVRTITAGDSPYDRWKAGEKDALDSAALRGLALFEGKARCTQCHSGANFTDENYHNTGIGMNAARPDWGRFAVTEKESDRGAFKTPTLRNVAARSRFFHDGSADTLAEAVDFFNKGGQANSHLSPLLKPLGLTPKEKADLLAFLESLTGDLAPIQIPRLLPGE